jgi:MgtC family
MTELDLWRAVAVALACGLLLGSERERGQASGRGRIAGVRTFGLVSLGGVLTALLGIPAVLVGLGAVSVLGAVGYARTGRDDVGATTEVALLLAFVLGALALPHGSLAAGSAVIATVLLASKARLHAFLRNTVRDAELEDALKFFVAAFVVLPLLPSAHFGPYGVVDPRRVWTFVVAITGIGWFGYIAVRVLGRSRGLLVPVSPAVSCRGPRRPRPWPAGPATPRYGGLRSRGQRRPARPPSSSSPPSPRSPRRWSPGGSRRP